MKTIKLNRNKVALVDDLDFEELSKYKWSAWKGGNTFYALRHIYNDNGKRTTISMHRQILGITDPKILTDHKNRNGLDNQRGNLRICNYAQNGGNRTKSKGKASSYKGVIFLKEALKKPWRSQIYINNKLIILGTFNSEIEAAQTYDISAVKYFGEFCHKNFN